MDKRSKFLNRFYLILFLGVAVFFAAGCSALDVVDKDYNRHVNLLDGTSSYEAGVIAQKALLENKDEIKSYNFAHPRVLRNLIVRPYPDYWFVEFPARKFENSFWWYLVIIEKKTGEVVYSAPYVPLEVTDYDWAIKKK